MAKTPKYGKGNKGGWVPPSRGGGWIGATPGKKGGCAMAIPRAVSVATVLLIKAALRRG